MAFSRAMRHAWPQRAVALPILITLVALTILAWGVTVWQARRTDALMAAGVPMDLGMTGRGGVGSAFLFLLIWLVMMTAMMFPSVWPVVLVYAAVARRRERSSLIPFLVGYLLAWESFGILAYVMYIAVGHLLAAQPAVMMHLPIVIGATIVIGGCYQFTRLKRVCLSHCQGPADYLIAHWQEGAAGALRMGLHHGSYCLGCCWGLMLVLVVLGVMDLRWMATVAVVIAIEKLGPPHPLIPKAIGVGLLTLGLGVVFSLRINGGM